MLRRSTYKSEKIIYSLLSCCDYADRSIADIKKIVKFYQENENYHLFLYKESEQDNFIALIGIQRVSCQTPDQKENYDTIVIDQLAVMPSFEKKSVQLAMIEELKTRYPNSVMIGNLNTSDTVSWANQLLAEAENSDED